jgi:polyribonucleotide nucleotidyltransferase
MSKQEHFSSSERSEINLAKVRHYLKELNASGKSLPMAGGKLNITAIAEATGVLRNAFYTNSGIKKLLNNLIEDVADKGIVKFDRNANNQEQIDRRDRQILKLEQQLANSQAETQELRKLLGEAEKQLARYQIIEDDVVKVGRRIIP